MKIKQYISGALMALTMGVAFTGCDGKDEPVYEPSATPTEAERVFFAAPTASQIVTDDATSFTVPVYRPENANAPELTVQLTATDPSGLFKVPATATFPAGSNMANITIGYDTNAMTPNKAYPVIIAVDEANANEYGLTQIQLSINFEQMTEWALFGYDPEKGRNGYGVWQVGSPFAFSFYNMRVFERHIPSNPDQIQYAVQLNIAANIIGESPEDEIDTSNTDFNDPGWITSLTMSTKDGGKTIEVPAQEVNWYDGMIYGEASALYPSSFPDNESYFDEVSGTFFINLMFADAEGAWNPAVNPIVMYGYADTDEYSLTVTNNGQVNIGDVDYQVIGFNFSETVDYVDYTLVEGKLDEEQIAEVAEKIQDDEQTEYYVERIEEVGNITLNFPTSCEYTVVAVAYNIKASGEAEAKLTASTTFSYETFDPYYGWTVVNPTALYTDEILANLFEGFTPETYPVSFEKNDEHNGLYRIANPYKNYPGITAEELEAFGCIELQQVGDTQFAIPVSKIGLAGYGLEICSYAYYLAATGTDVSEIPANMWITLDDNGVLSMNALPGEEDINMVLFQGDNSMALNANFKLDTKATEAPAAKPAKKHGALELMAAKAFGNLKKPAVPARYTAKFQPAKSGKRCAINPAAKRR